MQHCKAGLVMMPTGFRFNPSDEEIIKILERKVTGQKLPLHDDFILERNVHELDPQELQWNPSVYLSNNERYCYYMRETDSREVIGRGWWRATGHVKKIYGDNRQVVGYKRPLTFLKFSNDERKRKNAFKTNWIMHEYSVESSKIQTEWRLCKIKYKGKENLKEELHDNRKGNKLRDIDFEANSSMHHEIFSQEQPQPHPLELENVYEACFEVCSSTIGMELDFVFEEQQELQPLKLDNQVYEPYNSEAGSSLGMQLDFAGEQAEQQPAKALELDNKMQNIKMGVVDEQQFNSSYDSILTNMSSSNYYFDELHGSTLEEIFPTLWS